MAIIPSSKKKEKRIEIDLNGPEGNAFVLIGKAAHFCKTMGIDHKPIVEDMMAGDYEHLLKVFDKHFGHFVVMYR